MAGIGNLFEQLDPAKVNQAKTPAMPVISQQEEPDFFDRLFPKRDPMTGEQGGLLANPLFRIGMSLLARSGPQRNPTDLGQIIAGSVADFGQSRIDEDQASAQFIKNQDIRKSWKELNEKDAFAADLDPEEMLKRTMNPAGDPSALTAQTPTAQNPYNTRLKGLESAGGTVTSNPRNKKVSGVYQFSDDTRKTLDQATGLNPLDRSPEAEDRRLAEYNKRSEAALKMNGLPVNDAGMYASHLLGWGGGPQFVRLALQSPNTPTSMALSSAVIEDNPEVFKGKTLGEAYAIMERSIAGGKWDFGAPAAQAQPQQNVGFFSSTPQKNQGLAPSQPLPQPPAGAPQAPNPAQGAVSAAPQTTALPAGGPAQGSPTATPVPPLETGPNGLPTKSSILKALEVLPLPEKNQLVLGAWLEANGNKREFAENLGKALLARSKASTTDGSFIVGQPFNVETKDGEIRTYIQRRDGTLSDVTDQLGGSRTSGSARGGFIPGDPEDESLAQQVANYDVSPTALGRPGTLRYDTFMKKVREINPRFLEGEAKNISLAIRNFTKGQDGAQITALGTAVEHLDQFAEAQKGLQNGDFTPFNMLKNWLTDFFGVTEPIVAKGTSVVVADETVRAIIRGVGSVTDRQQIQEILATYRSNEQTMGVVGAMKQLLAARLEGQRRRFNVATHNKVPEMFDNMFPPGVLAELDAVRNAHQPKKTGTKVKIKSVTEIP